MIAALITKNQILKIYTQKPININIQGLWQAYDVNIGYKTPDNIYEIVSVIPFIVPEGKQTIGEASYSFNQQGQVIQIFEIKDLPLPIIQASDFISRFTDKEYSNIKKAALAQMEQGIATLQKWIDVATTDGYIDLNRPATNEAKTALIAANLLTQERADIIFSIKE